MIPGLAEAYEFDADTPWGELDESVRHALIHGSGAMKIRFPYKSGSRKFKGHYEDRWEGILANIDRRYRETTSEAIRNQLDAYMATLPCGACDGSRLKPASRSVTIGGRSLGDLVELPIADARAFIDSLPVARGAERQEREEERGSWPTAVCRNRRTDPEGSGRTPTLPQRRGSRLPHTRPCGRFTLGW